jgi:transketolase
MEQTIQAQREHSDEILLLIERAKEARKLIIDMAATSTGCHIGGSLSAIDLLIGAYSKYVHDPNTVIILSKGHAAAALYAALHVYGIIPDNPAESYGQKDSLFTGHPNHKLPGIPFATGSLGHGIPYAAGWALAQKMKKTNGLGIVIGGDGELQEGLCWETAQIVQAQSITNFVYIVDCNGGQNDGYVHDISPIRNLRQRFEAFGFAVKEIDGHHFEEIVAAIEPAPDKPVAILANTIKGKGVAAIEGNPDAHYAKIPLKLAHKWKVSIS